MSHHWLEMKMINLHWAEFKYATNLLTLSPDFEKEIHALIPSRFDYCNSLYFGISQVFFSLQLILKGAPPDMCMQIE